MKDKAVKKLIYIWNNYLKKYLKIKKICFPIIVLASFAVVGFGGTFIYGRVSIGVNKGMIGYCLQDDKLLVSWQSASDKNSYRFSRYDEGSGKYFFCGNYAEGRAELTGAVPGQELVLKMQGVRTVKVLGCDLKILGKPRILTTVPEKLDCPVLTKTADLQKRSMKITWDTRPDDWYEVYLMNQEGTLELYEGTREGEIVFRMEDHAELFEGKQEIGVAVRTVRRMDDYLLYSAISDLAVVHRADLMEDEDEVYLQYEENEDFTVITYDDTLKRDREEFAAEPSEVTFRTKISPLYCTVWPLTALNISEDISGNRVVGQAPAGKALCVLEETEGRFLVRYEDKYGYIDSGYCLIDLAEYLGDLCKYNITNSYSSVFRVHGYDIPEVTGKIVRGYENIHMENGEMLVPYLYPCAQKLYRAALQAEADGYVLCIYDAFRPHEASRYLYDMTETILDQPVLNRITSEEPGALEMYGDNISTYREVMTDNRFHLGSFLAQTISTHNRGIALDLTLVSATLEEELEMQSDVHDLSWYSIPARNNENADLLASYMEGAGYHGIASEWWHFQDDETRNQLNLGYLEMGVSPEGWKRDELGWKYRLADGSYYYAGTVLIYNEECTFNKDGYLVEE